MEQKVAVIRDGTAAHLLTRLLVPGDIILLVGGTAVPADVEWLEGDILSVDTAALTGEPLPRKYPSDDYGKLILCGATIVAGEAYCIVRKTGINTEIGGSQAAIMEDKATKKISVFEEKVLLAVKIIIAASVIDVIIIFLVQGFARHFFTAAKIRDLIASCLSIIIASVPVALPLVLQVTMALGAGKMAKEFNAVVTSLPALQDISSMSVLCSDKTGTLTTAKISIITDAVWCADNFSKEDVAFYAMLASNRDKKEDPIDRSVIQHFDKVASEKSKNAYDEYKLVRSVGFNPIYKRVLWQYNHPKYGNVTVSKGLPNKVINTADGGEDDADDQWVVENYDKLKKVVADTDAKLSKTGYKTLGVSVQIGNGPFKFVGILPMLDPPRHDTAQTIRNLRSAGINVKMITGDHLNIAKETARLIGLGVNMHKGEEVREATESAKEMILESDGFAQVLPRDKREVVLVLKNHYGKVVGMTGDGVNDAPALSAAQCGIAVDDATDAAKNAAAIILTTPGLSAIYSGVIESRRIFRKLKSYIVYRFAATIQIVIVLTLLIYIANCPIDSLMIVLLALFNDLTLLPIAYDRQVASATPEYPNIQPILITSLTIGAFETGLSMLWAFVSSETNWFRSDFDILRCEKSAQAGVWVQMFIAAEILIFSARTTSFFWCSVPPSLSLVFSILLGCFIISVIACSAEYFGSLYVSDVCIIWCYDIICLFIIDAIKVGVLKALGEGLEVLQEYPSEEDSAKTIQLQDKTFTAVQDLESGSRVVELRAEDKDDDASSRSSSTVKKLEGWLNQPSHVAIGANLSDISITDADRSLSSSNINVRRQSSSFAVIAAKRTRSSAANVVASRQGEEESTSSIVDGKITLTPSYSNTSSSNLSGSMLGGSLRPYTPANRVARK